jgi:hypothetical protein
MRPFLDSGAFRFPSWPVTEREASEDLVTQLGSPATESDKVGVAGVKAAAAATLGLSAARLAAHPAVFVDGITYTVVGIYRSAQRVVTAESAMLIPDNTALADYANPEPGIGNQDEAQMVIATRIGAAQRHRHRRPARPGRGGRHPGLVRVHGEERLQL